KHDVRNLWWIVDYNRQSLDATSADRMFERFDEIFKSCGWRVETLKHGKLLEAAFREKGGEALRQWIDEASNADYAALTYLGGKAWRERLLAEAPRTRAILDRRNDDELQRLMTNLAGHDIESMIEAFERCDDDRPTLFIAYTIKGFGLPFAGHKDNHAGLMNPTQMATLRETMGVREGHEWEPLEGVGNNALPGIKEVLEKARIAREKRARSFGGITPALAAPKGDEQSTQAAFGRILLDLSKTGGDLADRILTTSPDVTVSTNLGAWVNQRGLFRRSDTPDIFALAKIASAQKWNGNNHGQHVELGIAESNLFLMLAAAGLAGDLFDTRLFPIGTLYDPFIARGLDALNYACYQDARFLLVATPSGITLGPEGGAHQSINPPLIALGQPGLRHYEPAFADELAAMMEEGFRLIDDPKGESTYLRLSTRSIRQVERADDNWRQGALAGGYWLREPGVGAEAAIVAMGAIIPEALAAFDRLVEDVPGLGLLVVTSPDLLHRGWTRAQAERWEGKRDQSHVERLLSRLPPGAGLVTLADAAPASLSWLGGVVGQRVVPLGVEKFGQTGNLAELYAAYRLDGEAITQAVAELLLPQ
ncbi:MAG TPA: transketolase, partial [Sphingomicrobium sp.]|nr:transketolase [Sphingomicrobium sp.]